MLLCRKLNLFTEAFVAIDGSKFKAVNNRNRNFSHGKIKLRLKQIDESIRRYLFDIASADRQETKAAKDKTERLETKIEKLKKEIEQLNQLETDLDEAPGGQISLTDPDSRAMATSGRRTGIVGYNVQTAVDPEHHLIVAHKVTNVGNDRAQLANLAEQAKEALDVDELSVVADKGYYSGKEILACEKSDITTYIPKTKTGTSQARGLFDKQDFIYKHKDDEYECPAGERLIYRFTTDDRGKEIQRYWSSACPSCSLRPQCTTGKNRRVSRWVHEEVLERLEDRMDKNPLMMRVRKSTVEHPFGTLKCWMGATHFQMRTLERVSGEMSLHILAYNLKRMMQIMGVLPLMEAMRE